VERILARDCRYSRCGGPEPVAGDRRLAGFLLAPDESYASVRAMRIVPDPSTPSTAVPGEEISPRAASCEPFPWCSGW